MQSTNSPSTLSFIPSSRRRTTTTTTTTTTISNCEESIAIPDPRSYFVPSMNQHIENEESFENYNLNHTNGVQEHLPLPTPSPIARPVAASLNEPEEQQPQPQQRVIRVTTKRNYEFFPGNNAFFCNGRLLTSRAYWIFLLSLVVLIAPAVLFCVFV